MKKFRIATSALLAIFLTGGCGENSHLSLENLISATQGIEPEVAAVDLDLSAGVGLNTPTNLTGACSPVGSAISIASPDMTPSPVSGACGSGGVFTISTSVVFDGTGQNGSSPVLATTLTSPDGVTAQDMDTTAFVPVAEITTDLQPDGSSNLGLSLTDANGAPLAPGDTVMFTVRDSATGAAIEILTGDYGQPLTGYATDEAVAANSIQSYITSPGDNITDGGALEFDKLAWAKATGNIGVNKGIKLQFDLAATDASAGTTSITDSATIGKGFLKLDGALGVTVAASSLNAPYNCPDNTRFVAGNTAVSELVDSSMAETSEDGFTWVSKPSVAVGTSTAFCSDAQPGTVNSTWGRVALKEPSFAPGSFDGASYYALQKLERGSLGNFYAVRSFILSGNANNLDVTNTLVDIESQTRTQSLNGTTFSNMFIEANPGVGLPAAATFNPPFDNNNNSSIVTTETHDFNGGEGVYHIRTELGGGPHSSEQDMYLLLISF